MESVFFKKSLCALTFWAPIRMAQGAGSLCLSRRKPLSGTLMAVTVTWGWQDCVGIRGLVCSAGGLGNIVLEAGKADSLFILPPLSWLSTRIALFSHPVYSAHLSPTKNYCGDLESQVKYSSVSDHLFKLRRALF